MLEQEVWSLEGNLLAFAETTLRSSEARAALGTADQVRGGGREDAIRAYLRARYPEALRASAARVLAGMGHFSRRLLDKMSPRLKLSPVELVLEYLTYDGLYDLAAMRHGHRRWKAGKYQGEALALAESFFATSQGLPSAAQGITIVKSDQRRLLELSVFGARVREEIRRVDEETAVARVTWTSNYEQLRRAIRNDLGGTAPVEVIERRGGRYGVDYQAELAEYLRARGTPWATVITLLPVDEAADLYAGIGAAGGFEAQTAATAPPDQLPSEGHLGEEGKGVTVRVKGARAARALGALVPRRWQLVMVDVEVTSALATELHAPDSWFALLTSRAEYPELGVIHPELAEAMGGKPLDLPFTRFAPGETRVVTLLFDVPPGDRAVLRVGADELALGVMWTSAAAASSR